MLGKTREACFTAQVSDFVLRVAACRNAINCYLRRDSVRGGTAASGRRAGVRFPPRAEVAGRPTNVRLGGTPTALPTAELGQWETIRFSGRLPRKKTGGFRPNLASSPDGAEHPRRVDYRLSCVDGSRIASGELSF